jgi:hypothetical protein
MGAVLHPELQEGRRDGGRRGKPVSISAAPADPERPWGSARPEWLRARAEGRLLPDGRIRDDQPDSPGTTAPATEG